MLKRYSKKEFKEFIGSLLFFFLWPFGALIHSIKNNKKVWAKNTFWIFCVFYGFNFFISSQGVDAYRYSETFIFWSKLNWSFSDFISSLYSEDTNFVDIFQPLLSFVLSRFTDDPRILFATFGFSFGFFYSRNLWFLFESLKSNMSLITILSILAFSLMIPIWQINGFRFWTAAHIYLYGVFPYILQGNKKKLWISALSVFVHFTFVAPVLILILFSLLGNRYNLYFALFIISLLLNELNLDLIKSYFESLPAVFQIKSERYLTEDIIISKSVAISSTNWYIKYYNDVLNWIAYTFIISLFLKARKQLNESNNLLNLYGYTMLFYAFTNISDLMPQGSRFYAIGNMFVLFILSYMPSIVRVPNLINKLKYLYVPLLIIIIVVNIRRGFDYTALTTIIGNPLVILAIEYNIPLIDLIK